MGDTRAILPMASLGRALIIIAAIFIAADANQYDDQPIYENDWAQDGEDGVDDETQLTSVLDRGADELAEASDPETLPEWRRSDDAEVTSLLARGEAEYAKATG